jgi:hypothetical protein
MKSISKSVIIALLFLAANCTSAQTYQLLPDSNASWLVQDRSSEYTHYFRYFLSETTDDTLINGQTYTKIYSESVSPYSHYEGAFRNDTSGKIFFMPNGETPQFPQEERILQDFTKAAGDTVFDVAVHNGGYMSSYDFIVDSVRYYPCGPYTLKSVSLHTIEEIPQIGNFMLINWLEKIGNVFGGVFNSPHGGLNSYKLVCNNASDTIFYTAPVLGYSPSPEYMVYRRGSCEFYLPTEELVEAREFSVYPNPCSDYFSISTTNYYSDIDLSIFDIMGRLVLTKNISVLTNEHKIDFPSLSPKGSYMIVLKNRNKVLWKQVISKK